MQPILPLPKGELEGVHSKLKIYTMQYPQLSRYPKFHTPVARRLLVIGLLLLLMLPTVEAQRKKVGVV